MLVFQRERLYAVLSRLEKVESFMQWSDKSSVFTQMQGFRSFNPFTATGYVDIPPPRWPTFLVTLFPILKEGMGLSLLDEFEVQYHVIKK